MTLLFRNEEAPEDRYLARDRRGIDSRQMSLRQLALGLLRQGRYVMPEDSNANVVKIVVHKEGCIPLILRQSMAEMAPGFSIEQFPTAFGRIADSVCLSCDEMVEGRIEGSQRPFVGCNSVQHILLIHTPAEGLHELGLIVPVAGDPGHLSLPKSRFVRIDGVARQGSDTQQSLRTSRSDVCRACPS